MIRQPGAFVLAALAQLLFVGTAAADIPPPDDYVEPCTRARQEKDPEYCELRSAYYADPYGCLENEGNAPADASACENAKEPTESDCCKGWIDEGWAFRCKTFGGSAWKAMWCRARKEGDPARPADEQGTSGSTSDCQVGPAAPTGAGLFLLLLAVTGALLWLRRAGFNHSRT